MFKKILILIVAILSFINIAKAEKNNNFTVYYFHTNVRCMSCNKIEKYTKESIKENNIEFRLVNTDEPENKHFLKDYNLYTKSVVITDSKGRWKNLDKVWSLVRNEEDFKKYVKLELEDFMRANQ